MRKEDNILIKERTNIKDIVKIGVCVGCGTCAAACPVKAIQISNNNSEYRYLPIINENKCINCSLCINVCPGWSVNLNELNLEIFKKIPLDEDIGNYLKCYVGHSNDHKIRYNSSSGGLASNILIYALENKIIDGALVVKISEDDPLDTISYIAKNKQDVIEASGSKYCPVSINVGLREIINEDGKYAVVGLPCHIHGIRKAEKYIKGLKEKIVLHIGLLCSHMITFEGTKLILHKTGVKKEDVKQIRYRGNGWPGSFSVITKKDITKSIPLVKSWNSYWSIFSSYFHTPIRCLMCPDETCELSDISLGDAWLPEYDNDTVGKSIIVSRTMAGENILNQMSSNDTITLDIILPGKVKKSQIKNIIFKKRDLKSRIRMLNMFGIHTPIYDFELKTSPYLSLLRNLFSYLNIKISTNLYTKRILKHMPLPVYRMYYGIYKYFLRTNFL